MLKNSLLQISKITGKARVSDSGNPTQYLVANSPRHRHTLKGLAELDNAKSTYVLMAAFLTRKPILPYAPPNKSDLLSIP
jgi:hypothetical protein